MSHRSKGTLVFAVAGVAAAACSKDPVVTTRTVTMHVPSACTSGSAPIDGSAYAMYYALGDYELPGPTKGHLLGAVGEGLPEIDGQARAILVEATEGDREWVGANDLPATGNVDVLLLPSLASCPFSTPVEARTRSTLRPIAGERVLIVGGNGTTVPRSYALDLGTGQIKHVDPDLGTPRLLATVTAFGDGALVAGGADPRGGPALQTAEVYSSSLGGFDQQHPLLLSEARTDHGAVVLTNGETLLVGGVGADGSLLDSMEIIDPAARTVRPEGVARLSVARRAPTVLRLASGEVLVAGGLDSAGTGVPTMEWFSSDASHSTKRTADLAVGSAQAFVALPSGGALAVVAPPTGAALDFQNAWMINADGAIEAATPIPGSLSQPVLFGGAGGAPVLWTGDRWLRWQPWAGAFGALGALDAPSHIDVTTAPDPGLALWLDATGGTLAAMRFDERGPYAPLSHPLFTVDTSDTAPDRLASPGVAGFDASLGVLLGPGASAFVTDRSYTDVAIHVEAPTGEPAIVVLRDELGGELEVGGPACPGARAAAGAPSSLSVQRRGAVVTWVLTGAASGTCPAGPPQAARLSVGVRGEPDATRSVAHNLRISRLGQP